MDFGTECRTICSTINLLRSSSPGYQRPMRPLGLMGSLWLGGRGGKRQLTLPWHIVKPEFHCTCIINYYIILYYIILYYIILYYIMLYYIILYKFIIIVIFKIINSLFPGLSSANWEEISYIDLNTRYERIMDFGTECRTICSTINLLQSSSPGYQRLMRPLGLMGSFGWGGEGGSGQLNQWWRCPDFWFPSVGRYGSDSV